MINKNMFKLLKIVFIFSVSITIVLSTWSLGHARPLPDSQVNLTIPSTLSIQQTNQGEIIVSDFKIQNKTPVEFDIDKVKVIQSNGWSLDLDEKQFGLNHKNLTMKMDNTPLKNGENTTMISINPNSTKTMKIDVNMNAFDYQSSEKAFDLVMDYKLIPREFTVTVINQRVGPCPPIKGLCGEIVPLPKVDLPNFLEWRDVYTKKSLGETMVISKFEF